MKTYLITGGAGFIGSMLAKRLIESGHRVIIIDDLSTGFSWNVPEGAVFHQLSVCDKDALAVLQFPYSIDAVYHLAAQSSGEISFADPIHDIKVNYLATYNMLEWCQQKNIERFIFASSMSVYGERPSGQECVAENSDCEPASYYGSNKLASEKAIRIFSGRSKIKATSLRFFNVYGPGQNMNNMRQGMVSIYMAYLMKNEPVTVKGSFDRFRDFIFIDDLIDVLIQVETAPATFNQAFNVGCGMKTTVKQLLEALLEVYGKKDFKAWVRQEGQTPGDITGVIADTGKIQKALRWTPRYDLKKGLLAMKSWAEATRNRWGTECLK